MKTWFFVIWAVVIVSITISRLPAQDVIVTDPAWWNPGDSSADTLPTFKKRPKIDFPQELEKQEAVAYAIVGQTVDERGDNLSWEPLCTNPYVEKALESGLKYSPALREGKPVTVDCWFAAIFNPRSASVKKDDATPRLLAVAPVVFGPQDLPPGFNIPRVIWVTLSLSEKGDIKKSVFQEPAFEWMRSQVELAFRSWHFAPARRGEKPVEAELSVPLILKQMSSPPLSSIRPKALHREQPLYPRAMLNSGLRGEVFLEFIVDETGAVRDPVVKRSNNPGFNDAAIEALLKWKFEPGRRGGEPVAARMQQGFEFSISDGSARELTKIREPSKKKQQTLPPEFQYDIPPSPKNFQQPVFPYTQLCDGKTGHATVAFVVDDKGKVFQLLVKEASSAEYGLAVAAAVQTFEYIPALKDGKPTYAGMKFKQDFDDFTYGKRMAGKENRLLTIEKKHPEKIYKPKALDALVKPISQKAPVFPSALKDRCEHGEAMVEFLIDEQGYVRLPRIHSATELDFGYAAVQAIAEWRFEAPLVGGKPVIARALVPFNFNIVDETAEQPQEQTANKKP